MDWIEDENQSVNNSDDESINGEWLFQPCYQPSATRSHVLCSLASISGMKAPF